MKRVSGEMKPVPIENESADSLSMGYKKYFPTPQPMAGNAQKRMKTN
jgi:hypothetical protein